MKDLYFDCNGTTPILPEVMRAMLPYFEGRFGNPASGHAWGLEAREAVKEARAQVAGLIGATADEIYFTSCATEANNMVVQGAMAAGGGLVVSAIEHPAVLEPARLCEDRGCGLSIAAATVEGCVQAESIAGLMTTDTRLVSVMLANNETGAIQPVWELAAPCIAHGALLHTDAAQAVGKVPVDVTALGVDLLTIAGHKLHAPKGIGALYVRGGVELPPLTFGGGQERGLRPGTENVPFIVGLGAACALAARDLEPEMARQRRLGDILLDGLDRLGTPFTLHAANTRRLPNTLYLNFWNLAADRITEAMALNGIGVSAGAACHGAERGRLSHVLEAMGVAHANGSGTIRFSWGRLTTEDDVLELISRLPAVLRQAAA